MRWTACSVTDSSPIGNMNAMYHALVLLHMPWAIVAIGYYASYAVLLARDACSQAWDHDDHEGDDDRTND